MSYQDTLQNSVFSIITGDNSIFFPIWRGANKKTEYNTSKFEFINVTGSLIDRKKPMGSEYSLVFFFQGVDYLFEAERFEIACEDPRPIVVNHPYYGSLKGQFSEISRNDESIGIVEFTMPLIESIDINYPFSNFSIKDNTREKNARVNRFAASSYITNNPLTLSFIPKTKDIVLGDASEIKKIQTDSTYSQFQSALNKTLESVDDLLENPFAVIQNIQGFLDLPTQYLSALSARLAVYEGIYNRLENTIEDIVSLKYFEAIGASVISNITVVLVTPIPSDNFLVSDVVKDITKLANLFKRYQDKIDEPRSFDYTPDPTLQLELKAIVTETYVNLYKSSFGKKREKKIFFQKNTNPILVVHKHIGLNENDSYLIEFCERNNIKLKELFNIKKGRELIFLI